MGQPKRVSQNETSKYRRENPLQKQRQYINRYLGDNKEYFEEAMADIFEHDKRTYAKLYIQLQQSVLPKAVDVGVTHNISKEMEDMMMLGRAGGDLRLLDEKPDDVQEADFEVLGKPEKEEMSKEEKEEEDILPPPPSE